MAFVFAIGASPSVAQVPGEPKWEFTGDAQLSTGPVLGTNGLVYSLSQWGELTARDMSNGAVRWTTNVGGLFGYGSPMIVGPGNRLYVNSAIGFLALDGNTGTEIWRRSFGGPCAIGPDGTLYLAPGFLYAFDHATGATKWEWHGDYVSGNPTLSANGLLFVAGAYGKITAVDTRSGQRVWDFVEDDAYFSSITVAGDGTVLAPSDGKLFAIDGATGERLWQIESAEGAQIFGLAVGNDGEVWVVSGPWSTDGGIVRIIDVTTGEVRREFPLPFGVLPGGLILTQDGLYLSNYALLYALHPATGDIRWMFNPHAYGLAGIDVGPDGTIYAGITAIDPMQPQFQHRVAAVRGGAPLIDSPWPTGLQNSQHTSYWRVSGVPEITRQPRSRWAALDAGTAFHFYSPVARPLQIQWRFNGEPIPGATNDSLRIARVRFSDAGNYSVVISNGFGSAVSQEATLSVGYAINLNIVGPGSVQRDPDLDVFPTNTLVTLTAVPQTNRNFLGWSGDVTDTNTSTIIILDRNRDVIASFEYLVGDIKWKSRLASGPHALGINGLLYSRTKRDSCIAVDTATGRVTWEKFLNGNIAGPPAVGPDGTVYIGTYGSTMWALDGNTGAEKWGFSLHVCVHTCAGFGIDGSLYLAGDKLYAVNPQTGAEIWNFEAGNVSPAIGADGTVYACGGGGLYALDGFTGRKKWEFAGAVSPPALGLDGRVYVGSLYGNLYAINGATGAKLWEFEMSCYPSASPIVGPDNTVYIYGADAMVYALHGDTGEKLWDFPAGDGFGSTPALTADGTLYVASLDGHLRALDAANGEQKWELVLDRADAGEGGPAVGPDGTIYVEGYALHATSPLAPSAWPKFHRDAANQGRSPARPILNPVRSQFSPGGFTVVAHSERGQTLRLEWSTNLQSWNSIDEIHNPTGTIAFTDSAVTNQMRRFYPISSVGP